MNQYQQDICHEASENLLKAVKLLNEPEFNLFQVEGGESLHEFYRITQTMLNELHQAYYAKAQEPITQK